MQPDKLTVGKTIVSSHFSEPVRIETVSQTSSTIWQLGVVGLQTDKFRKVTFSANENCPGDFKTKAREILKPLPGGSSKNVEELRKAMLTFIGDFADALDWIARIAQTGVCFGITKGNVEQADALESPLSNESTNVWFTDPPYYNAIGYSESSDFFFVRLKSVYAEANFINNPFEPNSQITPKMREAIHDDTFNDVYGLDKTPSFYEKTMMKAFHEGRRITNEYSIASIVFAHKTTEEWESLLTGIMSVGWTITGSWPIQTEMDNKVSGNQSGDKKAMLLASVHLICRPRPSDAPIGDWSSVYRDLPKRVSSWMGRLQSEPIRGADLVFACIGPVLEIYSRYTEVVDGNKRREAVTRCNFACGAEVI
jgi:adenine-specific DNA methylase